MLAKHFIRVVVGVAFFVILPGQVFTQNAPDLKRFTGTWKEDVSKRKFDVSLINPLRFQRNADGTLEELRGPEARPVRVPVVFDGKPRESGSGSGNAYAWKQAGPNSYERVVSNAGEQRSRASITISADGKMLTEVGETKSTDGPDGKSTVIYERASGEGQELVGTWKPRSIESDAQLLLSVEAVGSNGLKVAANQGPLYTVTLDGTRSPNISRGVRPGAMVAAKMLNANTIEFTHSFEGVDEEKETTSLSPDGKSLVLTVTPLRPKAGSPSTVVYVKQ